MTFATNKKKRTIFSQRLELRERWNFGGCCSFDIINKETEKEVGVITHSDTGEITYLILLDFRKNGFAREALSAFISNVAKEPNIPFLRIKKDNIPSKKVAESVGFYIADDSNQTVDIWLLGAE